MPTTKGVNFSADEAITLLLKQFCLNFGLRGDGTVEGKSLALFLFATVMLVHEYIRSNMNDNLLALVANAIRVSDNYRLHNHLPFSMDSVITKVRIHIKTCIGAVYKGHRITEVAWLAATTSRNAIFLCGPGANRYERKIPLLNVPQWTKKLKNDFITGRNVSALLNNLIETLPSTANDDFDDDFDFKSPFSMAEPTPSPVKLASVKKVTKVAHKKQSFTPVKNPYIKKGRSMKGAAKPCRVSLSPVKNPYIKKGRSMK